MKKLWTFFILALMTVATFAQTTVTIGTGTASNSSTGYPAPFGNYYYGARHQFVYRAAELLGAAMTPGTINSIAFNVTATNSAYAHEGFTISMKNSSTNDLTAWETGLTSVFAPINHTPVVGWNTFSLTSPFVWDGASNIIVEVCYNNSDYNYNASTQWTTGLTGTVARWYRDDVSGICASTSTTSSGSTRPNIQMTFTPSGGVVIYPPTAFTASATSSSNINLVWALNTNNNNVMILRNTTNTFGTPVDGNTYSVGSSLGGATVIYSGNATTFADAGLTPNNSYYYKAYSVTGTLAYSLGAATANVYLGYCIPAPSSVDGTGIINVSFGTVNNTTVAETGNYGNYSAMIGNIQRSASTDISITYATGYTYDTKIWIDWNDDFDFTDAGEEVYSGVSLSTNPTTLIATFIVPVNAPLGNHRMRIGGQDSGPVVPCYTGSYGSFEDYTVNVLEAPSCITPTSLTTSNINGFGATLTWTENGTAQTWELEWGPQGFTQGTGTVVTVNNTPSYNLTGLTPSTNYAFIVRAICDGSNSIWSNPKNFTTTVACPAPTALTAYNITTTGARVQYASTGNLFKIEYGLFGFTQGTGTVITNVTDTAYNLTGLNNSSTYSFYVQQDCGVNGTSTWTGPYTFNTLCATMFAPFVQTFNTTSIPNCWTMSGLDIWKFNTTWSDYGADNLADHTGNSGSYAGVDGSSPYPLTDIILTSPSIDISTLTTAELRFWLFNNNITTTDLSYQTLRVDFFNGTTWQDSIYKWTETQNNPSWQEIILPLTSYTITGPIQVRFVVNKGGTSPYNDDIIIDDITINNQPTCPNVSSLATSNISAFNANLAWTENGTAQSWELEWGVQGFIQGNGTLVTINNTSSYSLSGLAPSTNYSFIVRANCNTSFSNWSFPKNFTTTSANVTTPSPANFATNIQINNDSLKWAAMPGALGYRINVGTTSGGKDLVDSVLCTSNYYVNPTTWNFNQSVYWKVFTVYQSGLVEAASSGSSFSFTTTNGNVITPSPANFATGIQVNRDSLAWAPIAGASGYRINIGTTSGGKDLLDSAYTATNYYKYLGGNYNFNQTIYWKVFTVLNNGGIETATTGSSFSFTTTNGKAVNPVPANNAAGIAKTATLLNWDDVIGSLGYYILVGSTSGGRDVVDSVFCANSEFTAPSDWNAGTVYFWRVYTVIPTGAVQGDVWKFTTQCDPYSVFPYLEDFTNWLSCWNLSGGSYSWTQSGTAPNNYAKANFWSQSAGNTDFMTTPEFNFSAMNQPALKFKWSHLYSTSYPLDSLAINVSTDNGATWNNVWGKGTTNLNSNDGAANTAPGTFVLDSADLAPYAGSNSVIIRFQAHSGYGPDLFIDSVMVYDKVTTKSLNLTLFLEGLYNGTGMNEVANDMGSQWGAGIADQITVELRNSAVPSIVEATYTGQNLSTTGLCTVTIPGGLADSYYVVVKHRNSVTTWSALPLSFSSSTVSYDFTVASSDPLLINNAYGDNLIQVAPGVFAIYVGDVNADGLVDGSDMSDTETENNNFTIGYVVTDVNGDGLVDGSDMSIVETANNNFVSEIQP